MKSPEEKKISQEEGKTDPAANLFVQRSIYEWVLYEETNVMAK